MTYKRRWKQMVNIGPYIAETCQVLTDSGWTVHSIVAADRVEFGNLVGSGAIVVAFKDEPDLSGGVPR